MADWSVPVGYKYNPSYHAYAYGFMYPPAPEQNHGWTEAAFSTGTTGSYYVSAPGTQEASGSPEQIRINGHGHYQGSGVVYRGGPQNGCLFLSPSRTPYDSRGKEPERARSDTPTSDSESHTSPDSWSSSSSREGSLPQADPTTWTQDNPVGDDSPGRSAFVSSTLLDVEPQALSMVEDEANKMAVQPQLTNQKKASAGTKARTAFSESQMNTLTQRFSFQRYLTPAEMKNLAGVTGLTYKQVKTWFQNRRMKLRRHQKDTSWVSERYTTNKMTSSPLPNPPNHMQPYQGEAQLKEHYNHQMREAAVRNTPPPQNLSYYLAARDTASLGAPGYAPRPPLPSSRPQAASWPLPPAVTHYEYNPNVFGTGNTGVNPNDTSIDSDDGTPSYVPSNMHVPIVQNANQ